jgi:hypothetical protein
MIDEADIATENLQATDGDIAVINLSSATQGSWSRFWRDPHRPGIAELIVEQEQLAAQFQGDLGAIASRRWRINSPAWMRNPYGPHSSARRLRR